VSELIAFVFRDQYRAPEVLNELRRRDWQWVRDLDDAVVITLNDVGKARVHLSVDLATFETAQWARLWGSLLNSTLFLPFTEVMVDAANGMSMSAQRLATAAQQDREETFETQWWRESLEHAANFKRDVAALMVPHGSAIFILLRTASAPTVLKQLGNYGDTIVHTTVSSEQDSKMLARLAVS
jgi:uncharacterized membrane protein